MIGFLTEVKAALGNAVLLPSALAMQKLCMLLQKALEDVVLDAVLTSAFDATPEKLEAVRKPVKASLHAMALKAARWAKALCHVEASLSPGKLPKQLLSRPVPRVLALQHDRAPDVLCYSS